MKRVTLLWHGTKPIGICVFCTPARSLRLRHRYFGISGACDSLYLKRLNQQLWVLARVVLHPTYRGAGLASDFVRASCASCPVPWIETLSAMGHLHPFFEKAGFRRVGTVRKEKRLSPRAYAQLYGGKQLTSETLRKSLHAEPVYYVFDNRQPGSPPFQGELEGPVEKLWQRCTHLPPAECANPSCFAGHDEYIVTPARLTGFSTALRGCAS